ncbi:MAG: bifunctional hydroxymethylpyrimidine kinase/phosphomethylpyrimidine kinase [Hyphomicrobiales bacterium]|jgi:hydroxymethylpyrimidine/phosphomethylpyrimidine kinase|nr:bifunctional hydroxymethylpyrimidine kinase/phosphomethylpyrimidine kinase [Hyphomicrobiales bacterium]
MTAIALTIAGSDSGGGAGIQADLKTFSALGVYGASVITAITAQNTLGVTAIHDIPTDVIAAQIDAVMSDIAVEAIKIGMLSRLDTIHAVGAGLQRHSKVPVVLDPVMVAATGARLLQPDAQAAIVKTLFPLADVVTPNLHEAAALLDSALAHDETSMTAQGYALLARGARAVLMKGGHGEGRDAVDLLVTPEGVSRFSAPRHATVNTHGTGCTLSSAIAAGLANGLSLADATAQAKAFIASAIAAADGLAIGKGHGPVHHFHALW